MFMKTGLLAAPYSPSPATGGKTVCFGGGIGSDCDLCRDGLLAGRSAEEFGHAKACADEPRGRHGVSLQVRERRPALPVLARTRISA